MKSTLLSFFLALVSLSALSIQAHADPAYALRVGKAISRTQAFAQQLANVKSKAGKRAICSRSLVALSNEGNLLITQQINSSSLVDSQAGDEARQIVNAINLLKKMHGC